ncbi:GtrA family protein [Corynebacterium renale]|uniref:Putative flippase GtrA n=1 Tax=Corynebacterium renale TaxID=1724 RepID=A0A2A9DME5_9CORY|nr:GtrA family protein [Corynebacterium renale]PFG27536.1 putative flippase GtrA [Corynebacterium renale]SQI23149.1 membrane protein [Corynebacterium renale]
MKTQAFRFLISGGVSAVVDLGLTWIFNVLLSVTVPVSRTIGWVFGTLTAYVINSRWTFSSGHSNKRFAQVMGLYGITYVINIGGQWALQRLAEGWGWNQTVALVVAFVISQGTATVINFLVQRAFIFKD